MKTMDRIRMAHKDEIILSLCIPVGSAVLGNGIHDLIVRFVQDEEMTVFPLGTFLTMVSFLMLNLFVSLFCSSKFNAVIAMGETRCRFFRDLVAVRVFISGVFLLGAELSYLYEQWKFATKFPEYEVEVEFNFLHSPSFVAAFLFISTCLSLLLTALVLRYERKTMIIVWISSMLLGLGSSRFPVSVRDWTVKNTGAVSGACIAGIAVLFCSLAVILSRRIILHQSVR